MQQKRTLKSILETYVKRGFHLFPVSGSTKRPVFKDMLNVASNDINELMKWAGEYPNCGWGLSLAKSKLWAVDIDTRHGGLEVWQGLIETNGEIETLVQETGSKGLHYIFKHDGKLKLKGKIRRGIDIKFNGYVILYPTVNKEGNQYRWKGFKSRKAIKAPSWVQELCEKIPNEKPKDSKTFKLGNDYLQKLVGELKKFDLGYDEWVGAGMALHKATEGSQEGLNLYLELTEGESFQDGDLEKATEKWGSFSTTASDAITERTLTFLIRQKGGIVPNPSFESDIRVFRERQASAILDEAETNPGWFTEGLKQVCVHPEFIIDDFTKKGFAFLSSGGDAPILSLRKGPKGQKEVKTMRLNAFQTLTAPYFFKYYKQTASGERKACYMSASKVWLESYQRKSFDKIVFKPKAGPDELNLWSDIPCKPAPGDVTTFTLFVEQCLCDGNKFQAEWLLDWLAHLVQKPSEKSTLVPVLIGDEGTGKGLLADGILGGILGPFYNKIMTAQVLKEKFNVEQTKKFLTFIDEATWRGDKVEDGILKGLTGSDVMAVEEKFGGRYNIENYSRYMIASNNEEAVAVGRSNRRYMVIECSKDFAGNTAYFKPLWDGIKKGKLVAQVYNFLLKRDISKFDPFLLPKNPTAGRTAKIASEGVVAMFWEDVFFENPREFFLHGEFLMRESVYQEFLQFAQDSKTYEKNLSRSNFWRRTHKLIPLLPGKGNRHNIKKGIQSKRATTRTDVERLAKNFCETLCIEAPMNIEPLDYFLEEEFTELH